MADTFSLDIAKFIEKAGGNVEQVVQKVGADILRSVVERSPVGNPKLWKSKPPAGYVGGRLRANWNVSFNTPNVSTTTTTDKSGAQTNARGLAILSGWKGQAEIYVMNSLPYVRPIEYEGHSTQTRNLPAGMVRTTVAEFQVFIAKNIAGLHK